MQKQLSLVFALSLLVSTANAGTILFNSDAGGNLTSATINATYTLTGNFNYNTIQIRILDAYPAAFETWSTSNFGNGFTLSVSGGPTYSLIEDPCVSSIQIPSDGGENNYDIIIYLTNTSFASMSITSGQTITISGTANVTSDGTTPFILPSGNDYTTYLADGYSGSKLSADVIDTINASSVPAPSTYAGLAGLGALGLALLRRRKG